VRLLLLLVGLLDGCDKCQMIADLY